MDTTVFCTTRRRLMLIFVGVIAFSDAGRGSSLAPTWEGNIDPVHRIHPCDRHESKGRNPEKDDDKHQDKEAWKKCPAGGSSGIARGDFNADGVADLAVGVPFEDLTVTHPLTGQRTNLNDVGAVHIIYGTATSGLQASGTAIPTTQFFSEPTLSTGDARAESQDQFGASLAAGDFNGDGFSDLAVGLTGEATGSTNSSGAVAVFMGSETGLNTTPAAFFGPSTFTRDGNDPGNSRAARSLTWGDFNSDGFGDLAVASEYVVDSLSRIGAVTVVFGSAGGLSTTGKLLFESVLPNLETHPTAPLVLTAGDFNADGFSDLVAGSPMRDVGALIAAGSVHILYGSTDGPSDSDSEIWHENVANIPSDAAQFERFGASVAVGDFNRDGFDDLAIGAPDELVGSVFAGAAFIIHGSGGGLDAPATGTRASQIWTQNIIVGAGNSESNDQFGAALASKDFNGDGFSDLAAGVPGEDAPAGNDTGAVHAIYGSASGLSLSQVRTPQNLTQNSFGDPLEAGDRFGTTLTAWNFGRSTHSDLVVGVPFEDVGTVVDAGLIHAIYGSASGLTATGNQRWHQNTAGIPNSSEANDRFGAAVY